MIQLTGCRKKTGDLTDGEQAWFTVHSLIDKGFSYCFSCNKIVNPISLKRYRKIYLGGDFVGGIEGHSQIAEKQYSANHCPYCGKSLHESGMKEQRSVMCPNPDCGYEVKSGDAFCPLCGVNVIEDPTVKLLEMAISDDFSYEEFREMFNDLIDIESIPPDIDERFKALSETKTMTMLQMQDAMAVPGGMEEQAVRNEIRALMRGEKQVSIYDA